MHIEKKGSPFTRQFIIEFEVNDIQEIVNWIRKRKRLQNNLPKTKENTQVFEIYPGENGAMGGKVIIDNHTVTIDMSWS